MPETSPSAVENVLPVRARLGEGPLWDAEGGTLYWVDIYNHRVHRYTPATGETGFWDVGDAVGCVAAGPEGALLLGKRREIALLDPRNGDVRSLRGIDGLGPRDRLNDGKCDPQGRFWVGSISEEPGRARLYRYDPDGGLRVMEEGLTISNGLGWSPDGRTFYLTDSPERRIYAYDFDSASGEISGRRVWADLSAEEAFPDGLAVDEEGCVWSAQWDGGCVLRLGPDGRERSRLRMPVPRPTACAFGGADGRDLYVTTASVGMSEREVDDHFTSGDLFRARVEVAGLPAGRFGAQASSP